MAEAKLCAVHDCGNPARFRKLCKAHYRRWQRWGDPLAGRASRGAPLAWVEAHKGHQGDDCLIWPFSRGSDGYGRVWKDGRMRIAARVMCEEVKGSPPTEDHEAAHSCENGTGGCVHPAHVRWATHVENEADKTTRPDWVTVWGTRGKLTPEKVREIRRLVKVATQASVAERYGVTRTTITKVVQRRTWGWVQ